MQPHGGRVAAWNTDVLPREGAPFSFSLLCWGQSQSSWGQGWGILHLGGQSHRKKQIKVWVRASECGKVPVLSSPSVVHVTQELLTYLCLRNTCPPPPPTTILTAHVALHGF
jgi:hypothetical protein